VHIDGEQWVQIATSVVLWVLLPFVVGLLRVLRAEVK
jgi:ACR3 family arsenite efflux pump ArsB